MSWIIAIGRQQAESRASERFHQPPKFALTSGSSGPA
jgi:hypothetical protein